MTFYILWSLQSYWPCFTFLWHHNSRFCPTIVMDITGFLDFIWILWFLFCQIAVKTREFTLFGCYQIMGSFGPSANSWFIAILGTSIPIFMISDSGLRPLSYWLQFLIWLNLTQVLLQKWKRTNKQTTKTNKQTITKIKKKNNWFLNIT